MEKTYRITNTTIKPPRLDRKTGKDLRTAIEKIGYGVRWVDSKGKERAVGPQKPVVVHDVGEGLMKLHRGGVVKIEELDSIADALKDHSVKPPEVVTPTAKKVVAKAAPVVSAPVSVEDPSEEAIASTEEVVATPKVTATPMGGPAKDSAPVNPDGEPNHVVVAAHNPTKKKRQGRKGKRSEASS